MKNISHSLYTGSATQERARGGYTLMELLAACLVLGIVAAVLAGVMAQASRAWTTGYATTQVSQDARTAIDMISRDLTCMYLRPSASMTFATGSLNFYATLPNPAEKWDICRVKYYVGSGAQSNSLFRELEYVTDPVAGTTAIGTTELISTLWQGQSGFSLSYYAPSGTAFTPMPTSTFAAPLRVFIQFKLLDPGSLKRGATLTPTGTYETSLFLMQGIQ